MLLKELKVPPLNTPDGSKFYRRTSAGWNDRLNWSVLQCGITDVNSLRAAETPVSRAATKLCRYLFIGWFTLRQISQSKHKALAFPFLPLTTKFTLRQPFYTANNTIQQTQMRLRRQHTHRGTVPHKGQNVTSLKQLLSTRGQSNNFPARRTKHPDSWLLSTPLQANESQTST